jgi:hypothetical protein
MSTMNRAPTYHYLAELGEVDDARIRTGSGHDQLRLGLAALLRTSS